MPLQATSGAASYDAFGGGVPVVPAYIEEVFSTYLYTSTGSNQTITNGIDLSTKGGLVWVKGRNAVKDNVLVDTVRGVSNAIVSNTTDAQDFSSGNYVNAFSTTGFGVSGIGAVGGTNNTFATWTFREQPKFFDVVTWTGDGTSGRSISHSLGSAPACVFVKRTNSAADWVVYHRSLSESASYSYNLFLNGTYAQANDSLFGLHSQQTSTQFKLGSNANAALINNSGDTYVAYLFAHDAGGFGLTGTDNVISCGSYTGTGATGNTITLGYEPQWVMIKRASGGTADWRIYDVMRNVGQLEPNTSDAEAGDPLQNALAIQATGFGIVDYTSGSLNANGSTYIYIAIRRGPMKVPTSGTSVYEAVTYTGTGSDITLSSSNVVDLSITMARTSGGFAAWDKLASTRLTGSNFLSTNLTDAETSNIGNVKTWNATQNSLTLYTSYASFATNFTYVTELFKRAPNFFDVVCYTGNYYVGTDFQALTHNLSVVPELAIIKRRSTVKAWNVYYGNVSQYMELQSTAAESSAGDRFDGTSPTATTFYVGADSDTNTGGQTYVMYLFATCAGVSKVGSYTGTATTKQIDCGFTGGARFVLIKRTDSTGDWYVWDSARGIVSGNDPYLLLNSTAAEVTNTDYVDTYSAGFEISSTAPAAINASGGSFLFLAIA